MGIFKYKTIIPDVALWTAMVPCHAACPVNTDAGRYVQLIGQGRYQDAYLVARSPNPLASVCGRICAAPCEDRCRRGKIDQPVSIRALKRFVTERYGVESIAPDTQDELFDGVSDQGNKVRGHLPILQASRKNVARGRRVAVIGAGPAGLACAHDLALMGYQVTIFEATDQAGGMMFHGIPEFRLSRAVIDKEIAKIEQLGVGIRYNTPLTAEFGLKELRDEGYESVFLSVGVQIGRDLKIEGAELDGVIKAVDYLININNGYRVNLGKKVLVVGGGFVAFDAARTALRGAPELSDIHAAVDAARTARRGGAAEVHIASLESFEEMPVLRTSQGQEEFEEAKREGIRFVTRRGPFRFLGEKRLQTVELRRVLSVFDASGRFAPTYDDADVESIAADACVLAVGQKADLSFLHP